MPSRAFIVRSARRSPPGIAIVTVTSGGGAPFASATSASASRIIARGAGLIAGSPTASGRPGRVTVPTPSPARKPIPEPGAAQATSAMISAPWVTSGSSPASLTMPARARSVAQFGERQRKARRLAARQADRHRVGKPAGQQRGKAPRAPPPRRRRRWSSRAAAALSRPVPSGDLRGNFARGASPRLSFCGLGLEIPPVHPHSRELGVKPNRRDRLRA